MTNELENISMIAKLADILSKPLLLIRDRFVERRLDAVGEEERFSLIYKTGYWKGVGDGSLSGEGSSLAATAMIREALPGLFARLGIRSMLDVPCGDWYWMSKVELGDLAYIGGDIVEELVQKNQRLYGKLGREFRKINLITDDIPKVDLVFVRDCLVHLEPQQIQQCLHNIVKSGSNYLATTTFPDVTVNEDPILKDRWRKLNLCNSPYFLPDPFEMLDDSNDENPNDKEKRIGVWRVKDLMGITSRQY